MIVRFLADEDLNAGIVAGVALREPSVDVLDIKTSSFRGLSDQAILELAQDEGRIVITHDRKTMTRAFRDRSFMNSESPGLFIVPQRCVIGEVVESLLLVWMATEAEEWQNRIVYLPLR